MSDRVYSDKMIEQCISKLLPNQVLFAMGDSDKVDCASLWIERQDKEITQLKARLKEAEEVIVESFPRFRETIRSLCTCSDGGVNISVFCKACKFSNSFNQDREYQNKYKGGDDEREV